MSPAKRYIYVGHKRQPQLVEEVRTTKTLVVVNIDGNEEKFRKQSGRDYWIWCGTSDRLRIGFHKLHEYSADLFEKLTKEGNIAKILEDARRDAIEQATQQAAEEQNRQLEACKAAWRERWGELLPIDLYCGQSNTMPDGSRVYAMNIPVHPENRQSKGGWELIFVHCVDRSTQDGSERWVWVSYSFVNGSGGNFVCAGGKEMPDDLTALWDIICKRYHRFT